MFAFVSSLALVAAASSAPTHAKMPKPTGSLQGSITGDDYPAEALRRGEHGDVHIIVDVDPTGAISCVIEKSSGSTLLDTRTCELVRERAKFKPALDRHGRPVASETHDRIVWQLMDPSDPWVSSEVIDYGPYGNAVSCHFDLEGAIQPKPGTPSPRCAQIDMKRNFSGENSFGGAIDRVILEERFTPGPASTPQLGKDQEIAGREVITLDIDATGKLVSCKMTERTGPPRQVDPCTRAGKQYSARNGPDGKPAPFSATEAFTTFVHLDRTRPPEASPINGSLQGLITPDDYPEEALDRGDHGRVGIVIRTDPKGAISDCAVEESSGSSLLDKQTCDIMRQRARFKPALDGQGRAVAGEYRTRIEWAIADEVAPSDPWAIRTVVNFAPDGRALSCHMEFEGAMKPQPGASTPACGADVMANATPKVGDLPGAIATVVTEQRFAIGRDPAPPLPAGDVLVSRQVVSLNVDAGGALTSCRLVETSGEEPRSDPCSEVDKAYLLHKGRDGSPVPFNATETLSVYVHVEKVALGGARARSGG